MNNWQRRGFSSKEEGILHVLGFLKKDEERIMSRSVSDDAIITCGDIMLTINRKPKKNGKKD